MKHETRQVPKAALNFTVGEFVLGDNGDGAKSAPFRMVARSGQPIEHWFWGNVVHDLAGMRLAKQRVPIDYAHDVGDVIGYANKFDTESGDLVVSGALVPFKDSDRATEVLHKAKNGVPYEASINFGGDGIRLEQVPEQASVEVNGYTFSGPGIVIREWPLRGIAVCPYGADANTSTSFSEGQTVAVTIEESEMSDEAKPDVADTEVVTAEQESDLIKEPPAEETGPDTSEAPAAQPEAVDEAVAALAARAAEGQMFLDSFGDRGGVWFAQGKSFAEAQRVYIEELKAENIELRTRLGAAAQGFGELEPVAFSAADKPKKVPAIRIRDSLPTRK